MRDAAIMPAGAGARRRGHTQRTIEGLSANSSPVTDSIFSADINLAAFVRGMHELSSPSPMAKLTILEYPDPRLRIQATPIGLFDAGLGQLAKDMLDTMYKSNGVGLAATQVNIHKRMLVCDVSEERNQPHVLVNPRLLALTEKTVSQEGCLSVPGIFEDVERARAIRVAFEDTKGAPQELQAEGLLAICLQHEIDHLDGKLFVDYLSELKRERIRKRLEKERRQRTEPLARSKTPAL